MLAKRHGLDWRSTFIEEPRVRYDGVYISVCHYVSVSLGPLNDAKSSDDGTMGLSQSTWSK
jgi:hypothetical protein